MKKEVKLKTKKKDALADSRFSHLKSDPKFSGLKSTDKKVVIDKRFSAALTDADFSSRARVDKRGRLLKKTTGNEMLDLYELEAKETDEAAEKKPKKTKKLTKKRKSLEEDDDSDDDDGSDDEKVLGEQHDKEEEEEDDGVIKVDLARGEGNLSSSDDSDSDLSDLEMPEIEADVARLDEDVEQVEWASRRLAACNLDWNVVKCEDLFILFNSFKPEDGKVEEVSIYLSDFGKERLEEEDKHGPRLKLSKPLEEYENDDSVDPETRLALRQYHIDRLKYYYAVVVCENDATASAIYENCDGFQFETTGLKMDLRFIPDDMQFEEHRLKEKLTAPDVNVDKYRSKEKVKSGIICSSGKLSWDETDDTRSTLMREAFDDDTTGTALIADSDSEDEETTKSRKEALMALLNNKDADDDVTVEWGDEKKTTKETDEDEDDSDEDMAEALARHDAGLSDDDEEEQVEEEAPVEKEDKKNKNTKAKKKNGYAQYLEKKRAKKGERKQKLKEAREADKQVDNPSTAKKMKLSTPDTDKILADDRFKALLTDSSFAIDKSTKYAKDSKLAEAQVSAKKKIKETPIHEPSLVDKLKNKAEQWNKKPKRK